MFGIVPIYADFTDEDCPAIEVRHWIFEPLLDSGEMIFGMCVYLRTMVDSEYTPMYPIKVTGEIK